ncbi:ABC transporter permease [Iocasia frigidifontis]|uniref:ABC transporter permease n=1 Tax=Iocasia fonsfrigidae TaxID=2682810 RepID=A0A8A7KDT3_9FIRM|nr:MULTISPECIES: ABC transporter permease [Halanaerobiaceae]AZO94140.1 ABC transporter permease [Halocella sp. SP3-1]QTL97057.1 ABC transporter permease [Iocasia fonsfrigidae]
MQLEKKLLKKIEGNTQRLFVTLIFLLLIASVTKPDNFLKLGNFQSILKQMTEYGLMSLGVGICMISGGIDLSTVYIANLSGITAGLMMQKLIPAATDSGQFEYILLAILVSLLLGAVCGLFNGFLISYLHIPAMLATLGSYLLFMGIGIVVSGGSTVSGVPKIYTKLGNGLVFNLIPIPFAIFLIVVIVLTFIMSKTKFGIRVHLLGTNEKAAKFAGIRNKLIILKTYMISGIISAIAGLISLARLNSAKANFGSSYTMQTILIVVLGGVNPDGGFGNIPGIAVAVIILQMLSSYLNMFPNISNYYRDLIWGIALIAVLIINFTINKQKNKR